MVRQMKLVVVFVITSVFFVMFLTACAPFKPDNTKAGACNELNSRLIFNGSTSSISQSEIQDAQQGLEQRTYDRSCE